NGETGTRTGVPVSPSAFSGYGSTFRRRLAVDRGVGRLRIRGTGAEGAEDVAQPERRGDVRADVQTVQHVEVTKVEQAVLGCVVPGDDLLRIVTALRRLACVGERGERQHGRQARGYDDSSFLPHFVS